MQDKVYMSRLMKLSLEELNSVHKRLRETMFRRNGKWMTNLVVAAVAAKTGLEVVA